LFDSELRSCHKPPAYPVLQQAMTRKLDELNSNPADADSPSMRRADH
jgi:hypothetical protein